MDNENRSPSSSSSSSLSVLSLSVPVYRVNLFSARNSTIKLRIEGFGDRSLRRLKVRSPLLFFPPLLFRRRCTRPRERNIPRVPLVPFVVFFFFFGRCRTGRFDRNVDHPLLFGPGNSLSIISVEREREKVEKQTWIASG